MSKAIIRHGFILILLALMSGLFIPSMPIPRLGLSAHTIGILSGVLFIAIGAIWQEFNLSPRQLQIMFWSWLYSGYINWLGCLVGALAGAGKTTPVVSAGAKGSAMAETLVAILLGSVALASFVAVVLSIWGLSRRAGSAG